MLINTMYYDACRAAKNINQLVLVKEVEETAIADYDETSEDIMADVAHELMMKDLNDYVAEG